MARRLIHLLKQREEMMGLSESEYNELVVLLEKEAKKAKETIEFYKNN